MENESPKPVKKVSISSILYNIQVEIHSIKKAMLGDEYNENGVMKRLSVAESDIDALKKFRDKVIWTASGVSLAIGSLFTFINYIMNLKK
ncbi:hypothetical protein AD998_07630 [bacterium 336/3]|nr:hypothetical protein AD998_07630 [bacterium 336/3]